MKYLKRFNENYLSIQFRNNNRILLSDETKREIVKLFESLGIDPISEVIKSLNEIKSDIENVVSIYNDELYEYGVEIVVNYK
jgi:hypothetical protein